MEVNNKSKDIANSILVEPIATQLIEKFDRNGISIRKWRRCSYYYAPHSNISLGIGNTTNAGHINHRRLSSGPPPISPLANKTLGEFVKYRKLDVVLQIYPGDMPLIKVIINRVLLVLDIL